MQFLKSKLNIFFYCTLTIVFITLNNIFKNFILNFVITKNIEFKNPIVSFIEIHNTGAAFSILTSQTFLLIGISVFIVLGLIFLVIFYNKSLSKYEVLALSLLSAGVFSNLWERITLKYVVDYIQLNFVNFPVFNLADSMIVVGTFIYVCILLKDKDNGK